MRRKLNLSVESFNVRSLSREEAEAMGTSVLDAWNQARTADSNKKRAEMSAQLSARFGHKA
jgi:hypothetical protein